jgi:hypothetical protein
MGARRCALTFDDVRIRFGRQPCSRAWRSIAFVRPSSRSGRGQICGKPASTPTPTPSLSDWPGGATVAVLGSWRSKRQQPRPHGIGGMLLRHGNAAPDRR